VTHVQLRSTRSGQTTQFANETTGQIAATGARRGLRRNYWGVFLSSLFRLNIIPTSPIDVAETRDFDCPSTEKISEPSKVRFFARGVKVALAHSLRSLYLPGLRPGDDGRI